MHPRKILAATVIIILAGILGYLLAGRLGPEPAPATPAPSSNVASPTTEPGPVSITSTAPAASIPAAAPAELPAPPITPDATAKRKATISDIDNLKTALGIFEVDIGRYPTTAEGLNAFLKAPPGLENSWAGPHLEKFPVDKWGHNYVYRCPGTDDPTSYDLYSLGPDGLPGTADDITKTTKE